MSRFQLFVAATFCVLLLSAGISVNAQTPDRAQTEKEIASFRERMKEQEKLFLQPAPEDRAALADFLRQEGTGLMRLLPREKYENVMPTRGGDAYYSFTSLSNEYGATSDLELQQGNLSVGFAGANFGLLTMLGDVALDDVTLTHPAVEYLSALTPPARLSEARTEQRRASDGFTVNELSYKDRLPARVNKTYLLRSINYEASDVLVAFRVVRRDTDGSLVIAWKTLKKFSIPHLERNTARAQVN